MAPEWNLRCWGGGGGHKLGTDRTIFTMELTGKQNVPSYVKVQGVTLSVAYQGQAKTCAGCGSTIHLAKACPLLEQRKQKSNSCAKNAGKGRPKATVSKPIETVRAREVRPEEHQKADQPAVPSPVVSAPETARNENAPPTVSPTVVHVGVVEAKGGISYADALSGTKKKLAASTPKSLERPLTASSPL